MDEVKVDLGDWPIVRVAIPSEMAEGAEVNYIRDMQSILDRGEPYAVVFEGRPEDVDSPAFNSAYMRWYKETYALQGQFCRGFVRVEPDVAMRGELEKTANVYREKATLPYPYQVSDSVENARRIAGALLAGE